MAKSWAGINTYQQYPIDSQRYSTIVFGAIGSCLKKPIYKCYSTTNKQNVVDFLKLVASNIKASVKSKPCLLFDQHRAHTSHLAKPIIE